MKKIYIMALLSLGLSNIKAQNFDWANISGLYAYDYGLGITTDNTGAVYVGGKYEQNAVFSGNTLTCAGNHDFYLAKYTPAGALTWIKTGGGTLGDYAHAVSCDGTNFVYVGGEIEGNNGDLVTFPGSTITLTAIGDNDILVAKYDLNGNLIWARKAGGYSSEKVEAISNDNAGNVYACGHYSTACAFDGTTTLNGNGGEEIFVVKYDASGTFQWARSIGGPGREGVKGVKCDAAGNIYITGFYSNNAVFGSQTYSTTSGVYYDTFIAKYDNAGNLLWVKTAGGNYDDVAWAITMDKAGMIYITGEFNASMFFGATQLITSGNADVFVACYNSAGVVQWAKKAGGPLIDRARGIGTDGVNIYVTGQFGNTAGFGSYSVTAADSSDVFFAAMNNSGTFFSALSIGGAADAFEPLGYESGTAICADTLGNVYGTGSLLNGGTAGTITLSPYTRTDAFVTKVMTSTAVVNVSLKENSVWDNVNFYPNPSNGNLTVNIDPTIDQKISTCVYNCLGQKNECQINYYIIKIKYRPVKLRKRHVLY